MVLTIEPGYYEAGRFGIRLENMFRVVDAHPQYDPQGIKTEIRFPVLQSLHQRLDIYDVHFL